MNLSFKVPPTLEIAFIPPGSGRQYPGVFLFSSPARMMRPVKYLATGDTEYVGSFEQVVRLNFYKTFEVMR